MTMDPTTSGCACTWPSSWSDQALLSLPAAAMPGATPARAAFPLYWPQAAAGYFAAGVAAVVSVVDAAGRPVTVPLAALAELAVLSALAALAARPLPAQAATT